MAVLWLAICIPAGEGFSNAFERLRLTCDRRIYHTFFRLLLRVPRREGGEVEQGRANC